MQRSLPEIDSVSLFSQSHLIVYDILFSYGQFQGPKFGVPWKRKRIKKKATKKKPPLKSIDVLEFAKRLRMLADDQDNRVVFFLGAGCSVSSDIPAAGELSRRWIEKLKDDIRGGKEVDLEKWVQSSEDYKGFKNNSAADHYSQIIEDLFPSIDERQKEIERVVSGRDPGFGYAVLAKLMGHDDFGRIFNKVLTTNFDDLVADALYVYSHKKPLVITHESLIDYARVSSVKPTVIKLHGDAHLSPKNTEGELYELETPMNHAMAGILSESFLVFIGYGGNDKGILKMVGGVKELRDKVYWVNPDIPQNGFGKWLSKINAKQVDHLDFDQLMLVMHQVFKLKHPDKSRFEKLIKKYHSTFEKLEKSIGKGSEGEIKTQLEKVLEDVSDKFDNWYSVYLEARKHEKTEPKRASAIYEKGIIKFPNQLDLLRSYGWFLASQGDIENADKYLKGAILLSNNSPVELSDYALFLFEEKGDFENSKIYFKKALENDPDNFLCMTNYGSALLFFGKEKEGKDYFLRGLKDFSIDPLKETGYLGYLFESYVYLHKSEGKKNLRPFKKLIVDGVRSERWMFGKVRQWAKKKSYLNQDFIDQVIKVIKDEEEVATLDKFKEWREA
jgi:tetratricopeptide (TPR) repeat protein